MSERPQLVSFLKFAVPFGFWLFLFYPVITGQAVLSGAGFEFYSLVKYLLDNLRQGVYPLWNPFLLWGCLENISLVNIGPFNPLWLLTLGLNVIGIPLYPAYLMTTVGYFFLGQLGFYCLAKEVLKDKQAAYAAFLFLLFSSVGMPIFVQIVTILLFVPSVWFFYFLILFYRQPNRHSFAGICFTLIIILNTYLPFYFLTVFLMAAFLFAIVYPRKLKTLVITPAEFIRRNFLLAAIYTLAMGLAIVPAAQSYFAANSREVMVPFRHTAAATDVYEHGMTLDYKESTDGGISTRMLAQDLLENLDNIQYGSDGFCYASVFLYIVLLMAAANPMSRGLVFLALLALSVFFLAIANATPLHQFLFEHVAYFRMFRNLHYFAPFLLAVIVLTAAEQMKIIFKNHFAFFKNPSLNLTWIVVAHLGFLTFFLFRQDIVWSSYAAVIFSFLFFIFGYYRRLRPDSSFLGPALFVLIALQPAQVLYVYNQKAVLYKTDIAEKYLKMPPSKAQFSFSRPEEVMWTNNRRKASHEYFFYAYRASMTDSPGLFMPYPFGFPTFWSYLASDSMAKEAFAAYGRKKFYIYDQVEVLPKEKEFNFNELAGKLRTTATVPALSSAQSALGDSLKGLNKPQKAAAIEKESADFKVERFDVNSIAVSTNFPEPKFLVYTDSYLSHWQAFVNNEAVPLFRANVAFKGAYLPAGQNKLVLRYDPPGGQMIYFLGILAFVLSFLHVLLSSRKVKGRQM